MRSLPPTVKIPFLSFYLPFVVALKTLLIQRSAQFVSRLFVNAAFGFFCPVFVVHLRHLGSLTVKRRRGGGALTLFLSSCDESGSSRVGVRHKALKCFFSPRPWIEQSSRLSPPLLFKIQSDDFAVFLNKMGQKLERWSVQVDANQAVCCFIHLYKCK